MASAWAMQLKATQRHPHDKFEHERNRIKMELFMNELGVMDRVRFPFMVTLFCGRSERGSEVDIRYGLFVSLAVGRRAMSETTLYNIQ